jgi:4-alpha-glucanotransferase
MSFRRTSGILLHPTSFPGPYGIGDLGQPAYQFVDFLEKSGQKQWQILPLGPTGYEHSPYTMNFSAFAGNPLLIDLDQLVTENLLQPDERVPITGVDADRIDFDQVVPHKMQVLKLAFDRFQHALDQQPNNAFQTFCQQQAYWLEDYALFMALLEAYAGKSWNHWEAAIARREPEVLQFQTVEQRDRLQFHRFLQFKFFKQWQRLRVYANQKQIQIIGDISIYVCHNSADVWANPDLFKLDPDTLEPAFIAGVPPDYFSATGQLWGNPVYHWKQSQATNYQWWIRRFQATLQYVDIVRVDHFRGFEAYWQVPAGETTAINGEWIPAPGADFFVALERALGHLPILAEDLGIITPEVEALRDRFQFPGMRILQFAFSEGTDNIHLPHHYRQNCVVYPGTHDNDTALGWWAKASDQERRLLADYVGCSTPEAIQDIHWVLIRLALASVADLAIIPLQDVLGLGDRARMNDPSHNAGNWRWRYTSSDELTPELSQRLFHVTQLYTR